MSVLQNQCLCSPLKACLMLQVKIGHPQPHNAFWPESIVVNWSLQSWQGRIHWLLYIGSTQWIKYLCAVLFQGILQLHNHRLKRCSAAALHCPPLCGCDSASIQFPATSRLSGRAVLHVDLQHGLAALSQACRGPCAGLAAERGPFWQHALTERRLLQSYRCSIVPYSVALGPCSDTVLQPSVMMLCWPLHCMSVSVRLKTEQQGCSITDSALFTKQG